MTLRERLEQIPHWTGMLPWEDQQRLYLDPLPPAIQGYADGFEACRALVRFHLLEDAKQKGGEADGPRQAEGQGRQEEAEGQGIA